MNAQLKTAGSAETPAPRFDRKFIEDHQLLERYLTNKLPLKGARDLENWCRANPQYLEELKIAERAQTSLKLLEASGKPQDLGEPKEPWWKSIYFHIGLGVFAFVCLVAFLVLFGKFVLVRGELNDAREVAKHGTLIAPAELSTFTIDPDRIPGINKARVSVSHTLPTMADLKIGLSFTKLTQFKVTMDKKDQGRALVINYLNKDSNGDLRISLNTSGLSAGQYNVRIDGLPFRGDPIGMAWLIIDVQ